MKIIICGAGQVGFGIARRLAAEKHDVTVVEQSAELIRRVGDVLDVRAIEGHGSHPDVLQRAGAADADMIIAVTAFDEINMVSCQVAHSIFNITTKIARVRNQSYLRPIWQDLFTRDHMPIDVIISPELEVARAVLRRLERPGAFETVSFADGAVVMAGVNLEEDCAVLHTPLRQLTDLFPNLGAMVVGIIRKGELFVPGTTDQMLPGDDIYFVSAAENVERALGIFGHEEREARRVLIIGAGNIGLHVAEQLEKSSAGFRVKLIEADRQRANVAADRLKRGIVLHGSGLSPDLLREAGVRDTETVLALTNDDQVNLLSSVMARREGCQRTVCLINDPVYDPFIRSFGVDVRVNPRASTVSSILQHVRRGRIKGLYSVHDGAAEVIEAEALSTSPLVGQPISDSDLPDGMLIGAVIRDGTVISPRGDTEIRTGDRVVIFVEAGQVGEVEQMFRVSPDYF